MLRSIAILSITLLAILVCDPHQARAQAPGYGYPAYPDYPAYNSPYSQYYGGYAAPSYTPSYAYPDRWTRHERHEWREHERHEQREWREHRRRESREHERYEHDGGRWR